MPELRYCRTVIWPSWAPYRVPCGSAINRHTGRCWQYDHQEETVADPIDEAEHFTREAIEQGVRLAGEIQRKHLEQQLRDVARRFHHHPPTSDAVVKAHETTREMGLAFATWLITAMPWCPERDRAVDAIDDAVKHANAAIARYQLQHPTEVDTPNVRG